MADAYWNYGNQRESLQPLRRLDAGGVSSGASPGYASPYMLAEGSTLNTSGLWRTGDPLVSPGFVRNDIPSFQPGIYSASDIIGANSHRSTMIDGPSVARDPVLQSAPAIAALLPDRADPTVIKSNVDESNILFVEGLPTDCTRREVSHLFRPFIGFKEIKVVHKEPRLSGDIARVICFVEFKDVKCAVTALEALQGYVFDGKKPDSATLRIQFARFPFRRPDRLEPPQKDR